MSGLRRLFCGGLVKRAGVGVFALVLSALTGCSSESARYDLGFSRWTGSVGLPPEPVYGYDERYEEAESYSPRYRHYEGSPRRYHDVPGYTGSDRYSDRYSYTPPRSRSYPQWRDRRERHHEDEGDDARDEVERDPLPPLSAPEYERPRRPYRYGRAPAGEYPSERRPSAEQTGHGDKRDRRTYVRVRRGDTVYSIARSHGVSVGALMKANRLPTASVRPGQRLVIPDDPESRAQEHPEQLPSLLSLRRRAGASAPPAAYTVRMGDTLYSIARRYGMKTSELAAYNGIDDPSVIKVGQVLRIPGKDGISTRMAEHSARGRRDAERRSRGRRVASLDPRERGAERKTGQAVSSAHEQPDAPLDVSDGKAAASGPEREPRIQRKGKGDFGSRPDAREHERADRSDEPGGTALDKAGEARLAARTTTEGAGESEQSCRSLMENPPARSGANFRRPVQGLVISKFGEKSDGTRNDGINISVPRGTPVKAAENGVVVYAGNELSGYGNLVLVRHADGWVSAYAHNDEVLVRRCDRVSRGQTIARAGMSGSVTKPQLHFELRKDSRPVDPEGYFTGTS